MKLNFPLIDEPITLDKCTILVLETQSVFADFIKNLYAYTGEQGIVIYDTIDTINPSELVCITDILGYDINSPTVIKSVYHDLEQQLNDKPDVKTKIEKLVSNITELLIFECLENELDLTYDTITILELIKALGVIIETTSDSVFEKCLEILQVFKYMKKKKVLIFINTCVYLSKEDMNVLKEYIELQNIYVLFVEPRKVYDFSQYTLDNDYFLIYEENK
ncbi:type II-A CRISPR-associated protein Csn2 [Carnobacteriaceae bacterium zg-84]|uniref:type II-A CRISPR-associated protein Csn2 n=1 Tax=Granulicatella sp. zg-84 TaxID=2678503 RepID=UPI0013C0AFD8|nr:type II-A CRISPR-associated protein Csn2 [Granulicatella sp. zg-84]NEW66813.1 type II-A CRISPR-associated protein Csn2 [Granulicatella sp. zg-84]QMI86680.1 type II-A CRISPR-associated protein Csn2 [Carnobacteriaceae bacterium zg-84]